MTSAVCTHRTVGLLTSSAGVQPRDRASRAARRACSRPRGVFLNGERVEPGCGAPGWEFADGRVHVRFPDREQGHSVEVEPAP